MLTRVAIANRLISGDTFDNKWVWPLWIKSPELAQISGQINNLTFILRCTSI